MKKLLRIVFCMAALIVFLPVFVFAQDGGVDPPGFDVSGYFVSLAALVPLVVIISAWLNKVLGSEGWVKQAVSWLISIILVFIGWKLKLGMLADITEWYYIILYGLATGLAANGIFDVKLIQTLLKYLKFLKK